MVWLYRPADQSSDAGSTVRLTLDKGRKLPKTAAAALVVCDAITEPHLRIAIFSCRLPSATDLKLDLTRMAHVMLRSFHYWKVLRGSMLNQCI
jgi:hypothetical protein